LHIIIDGYNFIRQSDTLRLFERASLERGRAELIRRLSNYKRARGHRLTVVFDGWAAGPAEEERDRAGGVNIVFSRRKETADEVIKRMVRQSGEEIVVVTSDRGLKDATERSGVTVIPSPDFEIRLASVAAGALPSGTLDGKDEDNSHFPRSGTKKKGPSKRVSKKKREDMTRARKL
jgi:uncharacterized protein